jgi:integrase/recombinase XerD
MDAFDSATNDYLTWMGVHNYAATTIENRRRYLGHFAEFARNAGLAQPAEVTYELVVDYQANLYTYRKVNGAPLSVATQVQRLVPVTQFFTWMRREHRITLNPTADLLMPRPDRQLPEATLSSSEMGRLLSIPDVTTPLGLRNRAVLEVFYSSALRRSELIALRVGDIDIARGTLFVHRGKGAKDRYVPIGERALFWVQIYLGLVRPLFISGQDSDLLFLSSVGTPICADWLCRRVRSYLRQAGINKRGSCHLLRHSVATLMLEGGADIRYVAEMLGHARLETTQRYTRVSIERLRTVHARCHPASGLDVAMASELCSMLPEGASGLELAVGHRSSKHG